MDMTARRAAWFNTIWYPMVALGLVTLIAGAVLALAHRITAPAITAVETRTLIASLSQVLPSDFADHDVFSNPIELIDPGGQVLTVYRVHHEGEIVAVVFQQVARGYAGPIHLVMGVDRAGQVTGVRVTRHSETPGLGDKIEIRRDPWITSFTGRSLHDGTRWGVNKDGGDFDEFSGATITPRAVVAAVKDGLHWFEQQQTHLFTTEDPIHE
jgi:electron transport complex protein RnfG